MGLVGTHQIYQPEPYRGGELIDHDPISDGHVISCDGHMISHDGHMISRDLM